jgi:hypothetical protein
VTRSTSADSQQTGGLPYISKMGDGDTDMNDAPAASSKDLKTGSLVAFVFTAKIWAKNFNYNATKGAGSMDTLIQQKVSIQLDHKISAECVRTVASA